MLPACRAERHVIRILDLRQHGKAFARIPSRHEQRLPGSVAHTVLYRRVVGFVGILRQHIPTVPLQFGAKFTCTYPTGQIVHVQAAANGLEDRVASLVLTHITATYRQVELVIPQRAQPAVQFELQIYSQGGIATVVPAPCLIVVALPIPALLATDEREMNAIVGFGGDLRATEGVVDPQIAVLVQVKQHTRTELPIHIAYADVSPRKIRSQAEPAYAMTGKPRVIAQQGPLVKLQTRVSSQAAEQQQIAVVGVVVHGEVEIVVTQVIDLRPRRSRRIAHRRHITRGY